MFFFSLHTHSFLLLSMSLKTRIYLSVFLQILTSFSFSLHLRLSHSLSSSYYLSYSSSEVPLYTFTGHPALRAQSDGPPSHLFPPGGIHPAALADAMADSKAAAASTAAAATTSTSSSSTTSPTTRDVTETTPSFQSVLASLGAFR
jgi:hypothetical protein